MLRFVKKSENVLSTLGFRKEGISLTGDVRKTSTMLNDDTGVRAVILSNGDVIINGVKTEYRKVKRFKINGLEIRK